MSRRRRPDHADLIATDEAKGLFAVADIIAHAIRSRNGADNNASSQLRKRAFRRLIGKKGNVITDFH